MAGAIPRMTTIERAFDLARYASLANLTEVVKTLDREGYLVSQIQGPLIKRQLTNLTEAARRNPLPNRNNAGEGPSHQPRGLLPASNLKRRQVFTQCWWLGR
jgi:hypothetical protein